MWTIAVLGLGRFGMRLARELYQKGVDVFAADRHGKLVEEIKEEVTVAVKMDITDEDAMRAQGIGDVDVCVVAIGEEFEATLMTTLVAKKLGARRVIARAQSETQADILRRIGADDIIRPEYDSALQLASRLVYPHLEDLIELDEEHSIVQLRAPKAFVGKNLIELRLRSRYRVNLVAIRREIKTGDNEDGKRRKLIAVPQAEEAISEGDILVLVGRHESLAELPRED